MAYLTESGVRRRAQSITERLQKAAGRVLREATASADEKFDVFLSHSTAEPEEIILGVKLLLEDRGLNVYVDKYSDPQLSPDRVTLETATILRGRMRSSGSLLYIHSQYSKTSRWMPWELGFFDGFKGDVGVIPVTRNQEEDFKGEEYLSLYPYVDITSPENINTTTFWINRVAGTYARLDRWVKGEERIRKQI